MLNRQILSLINPSYSKAIKEAFKKEKFSYNELQAIQEGKFIELINHCRKNVPYYSDLLRDISIGDLKDIEKIPFLTKEIIKTQNDSLKATGLHDSRFRKDSTSGSTGKSTYFFTDNKTNFVRHACAYRGDSWTGWHFGEKSIVLWGAERDIKKSLKKRLANSPFLFNNIILSSFYMTDDDMLRYVEIINKKKPTLIVGYPSSLELFSLFIKKREMKIHIPKGIITGGETLHNHQREIIESVFRVKVLNRYGCREVGHIANECEEQNGLHISSDHVIVEAINEKGERCKPGELGELVVTDLDNYVFPFIRYKIGDIGVLSERKCECGRPFPLLETVEGRTFDLLVGANGNRVLATFFTIYFKHSVNGVLQFQMVQNQLTEVLVKLIVNEHFTEADYNKIIFAIKEKLGEETNVSIEFVDFIEPTASGKHRWVVSKVSPFNLIKS